jgi:hypothetical protein
LLITVDTDLVKTREQWKLTLRKEKLNDYFKVKRNETLKNRQNGSHPLEVEPEMLLLPDQILNKEFRDIVINLFT